MKELENKGEFGERESCRERESLAEKESSRERWKLGESKEEIIVCRSFLGAHSNCKPLDFF